MKKVVLLSFLVFVSCENNVNKPAVVHQPFWLRLGEEIVVQPENVVVGFRQLITDFRCPIGADCVIAGHAEVQMSLSNADLDSMSFRLLIGPYVTKEDTTAHPFADVLGFRVRLMQLDPHPNIDEQHRTSDYKALLRMN